MLICCCLARQNKYSINPTQELIAIGIEFDGQIYWTNVWTDR